MPAERWYKNLVIYSLDIRTFMDGNGDGIGDFQGLIRRLDYLQSLGVEALWLGPFQPSPDHDNGYDVADYYGVDPRHGSSGDFVEFMHEARRRGLRVLIDLVVNHTSIDHPWFQAARRDPDAATRNWYIWSRERPDNWNTGMVLPGLQERTWTYDDCAQAHYFHRFLHTEPDLNMDHPAVREEVLRIIGYWLELGVSGFRLDALPFVIEQVAPGEDDKDTLRFEYLRQFREFMQWRSGDAVMLGEANVAPEHAHNYFGRSDDGVHMLFNFYVNQHLFYALAAADAGPLADAIEATLDKPRQAQWANFVRNHDELDLGRLTPAQRQTVFERFAPEEGMRLYGRGIRRRLAAMLDSRAQLELAYSALFALPGVPVLRYGDEIGMGDDLSLPDRYAVRTPMQWADEANGGFSRCPDPLHKVIDAGPLGYRRVNVAAQRRQPDSLLNWMARMVWQRKECPEIGCGRCSVLRTPARPVLALRYDWGENSLLILHNFAAEACAVHLDLRREAQAEPARVLSDLFAQNEIEGDGAGGFDLQLPPLGYAWFRVGGFPAYAVGRPMSG